MVFSARVLCLAAVLTALQASAAMAAVISISSTAPTVGINDVAQLGTGTGATGSDDANYVADDRPTQGQTFTTPASGPYTINSVTVKGFGGISSVPTGTTLTLRVTTVSSGVVTVLDTETATVPSDLGGNFNGYLTFALSASPTLASSASYGFDLGGGGNRVYFNLDGSTAASYAGGNAYSSGSAGVGDLTATTRDNQRTFDVSLSPVSPPATPEPASLALTIPAAISFLLRRRRA